MNQLFIRRINGIYINAKMFADYCNEIGINNTSNKQNSNTSVGGIAHGGVEGIDCKNEHYFSVTSIKKTIARLNNGKGSKKQYMKSHAKSLETALSHFLNSKKQSRIEEISKEMKAAVQHYEEQMLIKDDDVIQFNYTA